MHTVDYFKNYSDSLTYYQMEPKKQLKIKSGSVKRLCKDFLHYIKERTGHEAKLLKLQEQNADKHDLKKCQEFLGVFL